MNDYGSPPASEDPDRGPWFHLARQRVRAPGTVMQVFGAVVIALNAMCGGLSLFAPEAIVDAYYDQIEKMQKDQPPAERQKLPPRDETNKSLRIEGPIYAVLMIAAGIVMWIGGSKMKDLRGYGWSIAGAIVCLFPGCLCCCIGALPG